MEIYQRLLTTVVPTTVVAGNEGFVEGIKDFLGKIIEKVVQVAKWLWNTITGGGTKGNVPELSKEIDAQLKRTEQTLNEWAKAEDKLNSELKTKLDRNGANDIFRELAKLDLSDPKTFDDYMLSDGKTAKQATEEKMVELFGKEEWSAHKKRTSDKLKDALGKQPTAKLASKEAVKIGVEVATNKRAPKANSSERVHIEKFYKMTDYDWWARTKEVYDALKSHRDEPIKVALVNKAAKENLAKHKATYQYMLDCMSKISLLTSQDQKNITREKVDELVKNLSDFQKDKELSFWYDKMFKCESKIPSLVDWKTTHDNKEFEGEYEINKDTLEIINAGMKEISKLTEETKKLLKTIGDWTKATAKSIRELNLDDYTDSTQAFASYYVSAHSTFSSASKIIRELDSTARGACHYVETSHQYLI